MAEFEQGSGQQVKTVEMSGNSGVTTGVAGMVNVYNQEAKGPNFLHPQLAIAAGNGEVVGMYEVRPDQKPAEAAPGKTPESGNDKLTAAFEELVKSQAEMASQLEALTKQLATERKSRAAEKAATTRREKKRDDELAALREEINRLRNAPRNRGGGSGAPSSTTPPTKPGATPPTNPNQPPAPPRPDQSEPPEPPKSPEPTPGAPEPAPASPDNPDDPGTGTPEGDDTEPNPEGMKLPEELQTLLQESLNKYAEATAKSRNGYIGHFLHESKVWARIPFVRRIAERLNRSGDQEVTDARKVYEDTLNQAQKYVARLIMERGEKDDTLTKEQLYEAVRLNVHKLVSDSDCAFEERVAKERMSRSKSTTRIVNWWVKHDGFGGGIMKFAGVAGVGATVGGFATTLGVIAGVAFPGIGSVAGAAAGAAIGNYITKRRANAVVDGEGRTLAQQQSAEDTAAKKGVVETANRQSVLIRNPDYDPNNPNAAPEFIRNADSHVLAEDLTQLTERRTAEEMRRNRRRITTATAAGALGGRLGEVLTRGILNSFNTQNVQIDSPSNPANNPGQSSVAHPDLAPSAPSPEHFNALDFNVETGHGYTNELMDFAQANGHALSPQQAWDLHQNLVNQFGGDYINIADRAKDVYQTAGGDWRLSAPGAASWSQGVPEAIKSWMSAAGLWQ